jgi:hypothetical protein
LQTVPKQIPRKQLIDEASKRGLQVDQQAIAPIPEGSVLQAFAEPALSVGASIIAEPLSGLRGIFELIRTGDLQASTDVIRQIQEKAQQLTAPETLAGQRGLERVGAVVERLTDVPQAIAGGLAGIASLPTQGISGAVDIIEETQERGIGPTFGNITFEATGNPELSAAVASLPTITAELLGLKGGVSGASRAIPIAKETGKRISTGVNDIVKTLLDEPEINFIDESGTISAEGAARIKDLEDAGADIGSLDKELARQLQTNDILSPEEAERFNLFAKRGIQPVRSQITQRGEDFIVSQELAKGSNDVSDILASQDVRLEQLAREGQESIGGVTTDIIETNANLFQTIDNIVGTAERQVTDAYTAAREVAGDAKEVRVDSFLNELQSNAGQEKITGGLISSIRQDLQNKGIVGKGKDFDGLGRIDVETAESVRQFLNSTSNSTTDFGRKIIRGLKDKLDEDVSDAVGSDIFRGARDARVSLDRLIRRQRRDVRDKTKSTLLEKIIDNKIPQEKIVESIKTTRDDDFSKIKQFYLEDSGPSGIQAWNNFKSQVFSDAIDKAVGTRAKSEGGGRGFKGNIFAKQFEGLRKTEKFNKLFNAEEIALIDDIAEIDFLRTPKTGTISGKGPSAIAVKELQDAERGSIIQKVLSLTPILGTSSAAKGLRTRAIDKAKKNIEDIAQRDIERQIDVTAETEAAARRLEKVGAQ